VVARALVDETLEPTKRCTFVAGGINGSEKFAEREGVGERQSTISRAAISAA
jgi:hypothetical protein